MTTDNLKTWHFGTDNDKLIDLVLKGEKRATTSIYDENDTSCVGDTEILIFDNEKKACITRVTNVIVTEFKNITSDLAKLEGEGDKSLDYYRRVHLDYFKSIDSNFNDDTLVEFVEFEVVENLLETRLKMAKKIVEANDNIFGDNNSISEVNAGFNNDIFNVDNKYIIKVCANKDKEEEFEKEKDFYTNNSNTPYIPKLFMYDDSKVIVPFVYEVIEYIEGKSLYYYWYKMNEEEREKTVKEIVDILKDIHKEVDSEYDWCSYIKERVNSYLEEVRYKFSEEEYEIIYESFKEYDKYLDRDNYFAFIHNDLHFDNIIKSRDRLYLIDFNDAFVAPIDYDLRIFDMCVDMPWKWANIEMDPFQKPEDYQNLFNYLLKYYEKLNTITYLNERLTIYRVLNDLDSLRNYNNQELKNNIILNSKKILNTDSLIME